MCYMIKTKLELLENIGQFPVNHRDSITATKSSNTRLIDNLIVVTQEG